MVGWYLTLPVSWSRFWRRWRPAWLIKRGARGYRLQFDLHRAGGLWLWPFLFVFAWSSVMMNIRPVYEAVMQAVFDYHSPMDSLGPTAQRNDTPRLRWNEAQSVGERLLAEKSTQLGFTRGERLGLMYWPEAGVYIYDVRGSRDVFERARRAVARTSPSTATAGRSESSHNRPESAPGTPWRAGSMLCTWRACSECLTAC